MTNCGITDLVLKDCPKMVFLHGRCSARATRACTHMHTHGVGSSSDTHAHTHAHKGSDPAHSSRASQMLQPRRRVFQRVRRLEFLRSVLVPRFSATDSMALARDRVPRRGPAFTRPPSSFLQVTAAA